PGKSHVETGASRDLLTYWRLAPARHHGDHETISGGAPDRAGVFDRAGPMGDCRSRGANSLYRASVEWSDSVLIDLWTWRSGMSRRKDRRRRRQGSFLRLGQLEPRETPSVLVWNDEFNGPVDSAPDPAKWGYDLGGGGWGNAELEVYTNSTQNASITADP